jgi:hypothetical protein
VSQEGPIRAAEKTPRTVIEDLPASVEELSEDEASLAAGGLAIGRIEPRFPTLSGATTVATTCTAGNALSGADTDYGND